ncbi:hypothetical protein [Paucisalibacillus globulus]|uniref:hypothetical protein n=1 Tax=Paucisalibacillus globulus TaxID=351095 RepID=UPI000403347A|nr:hypothetical protein [Paucisalibacillus globulus]
MNEHIRSIADNLQKEFGLDNYILKRNTFFSENSFESETSYILTLEWFPVEQAEEENEDFNPDGSAVVDIDLHTGKLKQIIFVNGISHAQEGTFPNPDIEHVIEWVEEITGMMFGRQFKLTNETEKKFSFHATVDNIDVAPTGNIELAFNADNQLTLFSIDGIFPTEDEVEWEPFSLTKEDVLDEIKGQLTLVDIPLEEQEKWLTIWQFNQIFIRNDKSEVILPETIYNMNNFRVLDVNLTWESANNHAFTPEKISLSTEISYEDAMKRVTVSPLSEEDVQHCLNETKEFLRNIYSNDSGKWTVTGMYPEKEYIFVELSSDFFKAFRRKLKVIIRRESYKVVNYWDNKLILDMFQSFEESEEAQINKDDAFEKIKKYIDVTPVYVKDESSNCYRLCGRIDCDVVINGVTGEIIAINDL